MSWRIQKRVLTTGSKVFGQKTTGITTDIGVKTNPENVLPLLEHTQEPLGVDDFLLNKEDAGNILLFRRQLGNIKDDGTLIRKNNTLVVPGSYALQSSTDDLKKIPGPKMEFIEQVTKKLPIIKSQLTTSFMHFLHRFPLMSGSYFTWAKDIRPYNNLFEKYGDIVGLKGPIGGDIVLLRKPEHFDVVLGDKSEEYSNQTCLLNSLEAYARQNLMSVGGHSLKFIPPTYDSLQEFDFLRSFKASEEQNSVSNDVIKRIEELNQLQYEVPPDFYLELCKWGLSWQQRLMFNPENIPFLDQQQLKFGTAGAKMLSAFIEASDALRKCESGFQLWRIYNTPSWEKLISSCDRLCVSFIKQIQTAEAGLVKQKDIGTSKNLTEYLVMTKNANLDDALLDMLEMTLVGVNVIAFTMGFLLYHLSKAPRVQTKLHEEIKSIFKDKKTNITFDDVDKLVYLKACVKEALRLQLPIPFCIRKLHKDISISNYIIPKNTYIVMAHENACLSKDNFEEPDRFLPERWMTATAQSLIDPLKIQPYGNGFCSSIVKILAEKQMCLLTAKIIRNFWVFYSFDEITSDGKILAMPTHPFRFLFEQRRN